MQLHRTLSRQLWPPCLSRVSPIDSVERSCILMPLLLRHTWRELDTANGAGAKLQQGEVGVGLVREQVTPARLPPGPDPTQPQLLPQPALGNADLVGGFRHR